MKVVYKKRFLKELAKIPSEQRRKIEHFVFAEAPNLTSLSQSRSVKKLKGFQTYYRVRFGDYRVGLNFEDNTLTFERVAHRKDIYRVFP